MSLKERELILIRHRNRLLAGICLESDRKGLRVETADQGTVRVPEGNLLVSTGQVAGDVREAAAWWNEVTATGEELDLREVWELVREESVEWPLEELAELCPGDVGEDGLTVIQLAAVLVALDSSMYFDAGSSGFLPADEAAVQERVEAVEREAQRETARDRFRDWLSGEGEPEGDWVDRLKDVVLQGEASPHARWVNREADWTVSPSEVFERLVSAGVWERHAHLDLVREEVPTEFSPEAMAVAVGVRLEDLPRGQRQDLTDLPLFTVDDAWSADLDDAISITQDIDGNWRFGVHITDASALVAPGSALDVEAADRMTSLYFPERKLPMLPAELSESLGSLVPGVDRLAVSVLGTLEDGRLPANPDVVLSVVRSRQRLSYEEADAILSDATHAQHPSLATLYEAAEAHWMARTEAGAVTVERPEWQVSVDDGVVTVALRDRNAQSQLLVSELMVYTNSAIARLCRDLEVPSLYRTQPRADLSALQDLEPEPLRRFRMLRKLQPATMSVEPGFHGALGIDAYCQVTSPLRRYLDLVIQRQLCARLSGVDLPYTTDQLLELASTTHPRLRLLRRLEGARKRYWLNVHLLDQWLGERFEAVVVDPSGSEIRAETIRFGIPATLRPEGKVEVGEVICAKLVKVDPLGDATGWMHERQ